jgi:hypothetical protein
MTLGKLVCQLQKMIGPNVAFSLVSPVMYDDWVAWAGGVNRVANSPTEAVRQLIIAVQKGELDG